MPIRYIQERFSAFGWFLRIDHWASRVGVSFLVDAIRSVIMNHYMRPRLIARAFPQGGASVPLFQQVLLETVSICNSDCSFCPANVHTSDRKFKLMPLDLIDKIFHELHELGFAGQIAFFGNNEPLIDKRLPEIVGAASKIVPRASTLICTNGILLSFELYQELIDRGLDEFVVNNYADDERLIRPVRQFVDAFENLESRSKHLVSIKFQKKSAVLTNKGGGAPNKLNRAEFLRTRNLFCSYPFAQLNINCAGDVTICCNDAHYNNVVGNIAQQTIAEVWNGELMCAVRRKLAACDRSELTPCSQCDVMGIMKLHLKVVDTEHGPQLSA